MTPQSQLMADISDYQLNVELRRYRRAGRRAIMLKATDADTDAGAALYPNRVELAHNLRLVVIHYAIVRYNVDPDRTIDHYAHRIKPYWRRGDKMLIDVEDYSGHPNDAAGWLQRAQDRLTGHWQAPRAWGYTNEAYMAEAGLQLADAAPYWIIAAYDWRLLGAGTPKLPRAARTTLAGKQYTDGVYGAQPLTAPGIGPCDDTILTPAGERALLRTTAPKLKRPIRAKLPSRKKTRCC